MENALMKKVSDMKFIYFFVSNQIKIEMDA